MDHIKNTLSIVFSSVQWLILDEADRSEKACDILKWFKYQYECVYVLLVLCTVRILDMGFEKDLTVILNALNATGVARQNVLLSATLNEGELIARSVHLSVLALV